MSFSAEREEVSRGARTLVVIPDDVVAARRNGHSGRDREGRVEEARGLAAAIGVDILDTIIVPLRRLLPATLLGPGQVETIAERATRDEVELVIIDASLTAIQQRNLERTIGAKVIDRTALILEIFGERAATAEGRLQVELAHLDYQQGRLVRSWTHLERQRGGFGFLGGPGETQIEADRRMIRDRMARLRRQLDDVARTRGLHRERRRRAPWPVVALVGYTNAGKSTLFNALAGGGAVAEDALFATLDPTMRRVEIDGVGAAIVSDTVGFVSDLPTQLVAAFRATLEEVRSADLLLHVRDVSHPETLIQRDDVMKVLGELGIGPLAERAGGDGAVDDSGTLGPPILEVHNKLDMLHGEARATALAEAERVGAVAVSALQGEGLDALRARIASLLGGESIERDVHLSADEGATLAWLYDHAQVVERRDRDDGGQDLRIRLSSLNHARLNHRRSASADQA